MVTDNRCQTGFDRSKILEPSIRCNDMFSIDHDTSTNSSKLILQKTGEQFNDYSFATYDDLTYSASVCRRNEDTTIREG